MNESADKILTALARAMSFGVVKNEGSGSQFIVGIKSPQIRLSDINTSKLEDLFSSMLNLRVSPYQGRKVDALEMKWINTSNESANPFRGIGYFQAFLYSKPDTPQATQGAKWVRSTPQPTQS